MADDAPDKSSKGDAEILSEACRRFAYVDEVDGHNRKAQLEDTRFVYEEGAQWDAEVKRKRTAWNLPSLTFNQLKQFVHQVVNDQRQGRPGVKISPASGDASEKVAELKQDLIRGIEQKSHAETAYDNGFRHAVVGGAGYWRVRSDYESRKSFNQCIVVDTLPDPLAVRMDPDFQRADASDAQWCFVVQPVKKQDYERLYGKDVLSWAPSEDNQAWYPDSETVLVADYYRIVKRTKKLVQLDNGMCLWEDELKQRKTEFPQAKVVQSADREYQVCEWYKLAGGEKIVDRPEWRGQYIPVIMCMGDEIVIEGKKIRQGLIRQAKEPQQLYNFGMTQQAVSLALTPKAPWVAAQAAIEGHEAIWQRANEENYSVLPYNHRGPEADDAIPAPQRQQPSFPDAGWISWSQQMLQQIRSTIGMYENSLGMKGQESSGRAILAREQQGDNATFHYIDNLSRAIAHTGQVINDLIPHYYDSERLVSLVAHDGEQRMAQVNEMVPRPQPDGTIMYVLNPDNDVTRGEYAVTVESGPSYSTKREQTRSTLVELFQAFPPAAQILGDKLLAVIDMPDAKDAAERFKTMLPPAIQQMEAAKKQGQTPPDPQMLAQMQQMQQQMQQAQQMLQQLQQENQQLKQGEQSKVQAAQMSAQVDMQKAQMDVQTESEKAQMQAQADMQRAQLDAHTKVQTKLIEVAGQIFAGQIAPPAQPADSAGEALPDPTVATLAPEQILAGVAEIAQQLAAAFNMPKTVTLDNGRTATVQTVQPEMMQ